MFQYQFYTALLDAHGFASSSVCCHLRKGSAKSGIHPALYPAFRVRRGTRSPCVDIRGYIGSRASGYPPDLVSFRRALGRPPTSTAGAVSPSISLGESCSGKSRGRAGMPTDRDRFRHGISSYGGKAAPTRATLQRLGNRECDRCSNSPRGQPCTNRVEPAPDRWRSGAAVAEPSEPPAPFPRALVNLASGNGGAMLYTFTHLWTI